jgi:predicted nuclease with TOPRIM domain
MDERTAEILEELRAENRRLRERIDQLENENRRLREQLEEALKLAARQAAPFRRDERDKIPTKKKKRTGRKDGNIGCYQQRPEHIEQIVEVTLDSCTRCGGSVKD